MRALSFVVLAACAAAQVPSALEVAAVPAAVDLRLTAAPPGGLAALVLGFHGLVAPLPGGAVLGVEPIVVLPLALVDAHGNAPFALSLPAAPPLAGCLAQGLTLDLGLPFGAAGSSQGSVVHDLRFHQPGDLADVVVLFGQSNAEGYASLAGLPDALHGALPAVRTWNPYAGRFEPLQAGVNNMLFLGVPFGGPELGIAQAAALAAGAAPVYLCKMALPATSLGPGPGAVDEWAPAAGELYPELLARLDAVFAALRAAGQTPRVRVLAFVQGESDSLDAKLASGYATRLLDLAQSLRRDLAERGVDGGVPPWFCPAVLPASLGPRGFRHVGPVRNAQASLGEVLPRVVPLPMDGLPLQADGVHLTLDGVRGLGAAVLFPGWR